MPYHGWCVLKDIYIYIYIFLYFGPTGTLLVSKLSLVKFCCTLIHSDASCVIIFVLDLPS